MPKQLATYSFLDVQAAITGPGGAFDVGSDAAPAEEGIDIEFTEPSNRMVIGAAGDAMHALNGSKAAKVTLRYLKTSPVNALLSALWNFQRSGGGATWGQNVLSVTNIQTGDVYTCQQGAFQKHAANKYDKTGKMIEWEFDFGIVDPLLGVGLSNVSI